MNVKVFKRLSACRCWLLRAHGEAEEGTMMTSRLALETREKHYILMYYILGLYMYIRKTECVWDRYGTEFSRLMALSLRKVSLKCPKCYNSRM